MSEDLQQHALRAVELAKQAGASDVWTTLARDRSVSFTYRDRTMEKVEESTSRGLSLRIYVEGRYGVHGTTDLRPDHLRQFIHEAVALTKALQPDPYRQIPDPQLFKNRPTDDLQRLDPSLASIDREQWEAWCEQMDASAHAHEKVLSAESSVFSSENEGASASSNGFLGNWNGAHIGFSSVVTVREDSDKRPEESYYAVGRFLQDLPQPAEIAREALTRALRRLGSRKGPTMRTTMVLAPEAAVSLLGKALGPGNAASIQQGRSFWREQIGRPLFGSQLTILDDPLTPRGLSSRHFDGEGIAARKLPIIEAGVVRNIYVDTYYGRKIGMQPTTGSPSNRIVRLGEKSSAQILREVSSGIYVTSWLGGNSDSTTGDFSLGLRGYLIENGELGAPIGEMNVTGNLAKLFQGLELVGNDPFPYASLRVPTLGFRDVQFSGT